MSYASIPVIKPRVQVTWIRTERKPNGLPVDRISHPLVYPVIDPDNYERYFFTKKDAQNYVDNYLEALR